MAAAVPATRDLEKRVDRKYEKEMRDSATSQNRHNMTVKSECLKGYMAMDAQMVPETAMVDQCVIPQDAQ
jgi:hypothetical protein